MQDSEKPCWSFLNAAAHDLKTPLNSIIGFGDMLSREGSEIQRRMGLHVYENGHNLLNMLNRIIEYSKLETGKSLAIPTECDIVSDIECCIRSLNQSGRIKLEIEMDDRPFITDAHIFKRILTELITNALTYSPDSSEVCVTASRENTEPGQETLRVDISDKGPGIPAEKIPDLFQPGGKAGMYSQGYKEGLGLGLAFTAISARKLNGYITIVPAPDGKIFSLVIGQLNSQL